MPLITKPSETLTRPRAPICGRIAAMEVNDIWDEFDAHVGGSDEDIDLAYAALLIAATENSRLNIRRELYRLDMLADGVSYRIDDDSPLYQANTLSEYLFDELKFAGNHTDYYDPRNSFLNEVIERRLGIPITLSLLYIELGKRLNIPFLGIGMPAHFIVRHRDESDVFIDPYHGGILLSEDECAQRLKQATQGGLQWNPAYLRPITNRAFIARLLRNLKVVHLQRGNYLRVLGTINRLIALEPFAYAEYRDRGVILYRLGRYEAALNDLRYYVRHNSKAQDANTVNKLIAQIRAKIAT